MRARCNRVGLVEEITRAEDRKMSLGKDHAVGDIRLGERSGVDFSGEVTGFVGITFAATRAASQAKADVVLGEDVGEPLDFAGVRHREQNLISVARELLDFFQHRGNRAMKAGSRLREKRDGRSSSSPRAMPRCSMSAPVSAVIFCHHASGETYKSVGRTRLPTPLRS